MYSALRAQHSSRAWGQRPRNPIAPSNQALKARFTSGPFRSIIGIMPQAQSKVIVPIIFSTTDREPWLGLDMRPRMDAYLAIVCRDLGAEVVRVGGVADHVHIVTTLPRTRLPSSIDRAGKENVLKVIAKHSSASPC